MNELILSKLARSLVLVGTITWHATTNLSTAFVGLFSINVQHPNAYPREKVENDDMVSAILVANHLCGGVF